MSVPLVPPAPISNRAFFFQFVSTLEDKRQKCALCMDQVWSEKTSASVIEKHFEHVHCAVWKNRPVKRAPIPNQIPIADAFKGADASFDAIVELFIHHPGIPLSLCRSKHFKSVLKTSINVTNRKIREKIIEKDQRYFDQLKERLRGKKVGIQIDGGKGVDGRKIIGVCVVMERICYCFKIIFVEDGDILTADWYKDLLLTVIAELEALGAIVVSATLDNEASPNAGMRPVLALKPYLIHNRCAPHTVELLIEDLQSEGTRTHPREPAIPLLKFVTENVHNVVTAIRNSKYLSAALNEAQRNRMAGKVLSLVKPANTRKWSTGFLMLARFCHLYADIAMIEHFMATRDNPELCEVQAKETWVNTQKLLVPSRIQCEAVRELLYWIYVGEQAMQRDGASVIHASFIVEEIFSALESTSPSHRVPRLIQNDMDSRRVSLFIAERRTLLQSSGVYWLSLVLWPKATVYAYEHHLDANYELETFANKCWSLWQRNRAVLRLPTAFHCDLSNQADSELKLTACINAAQEELTEHLAPNLDITRRHQTSFESRSAAVAVRLRDGDRSVKRGRVVADGVNESDAESYVHVHQYWAAVASHLPLLSMIARLLLACCASEAGVERLFSKEGFIHTSYRNLLQRDILLALVRSCMNRHALDDIALRMDQSDDSDND